MDCYKIFIDVFIEAERISREMKKLCLMNAMINSYNGNFGHLSKLPTTDVIYALFCLFFVFTF